MRARVIGVWIAFALAAAALFAESCLPWEQGCRSECKTLDAIAWCRESDQCTASPPNPQSYSFDTFPISSSAKTLSIPISALGGDSYEIVDVLAQAGAPLGNVSISVLNNGYSATCTVSTPSAYERSFHCTRGPGTSVLSIVAGPTPVAFSVYVTFADTDCAEKVEICGA